MSVPDDFTTVQVPTWAVRLASEWTADLNDGGSILTRAIGDACRDALPKMCTIEIPVEVRGLWADRPLGPYTREIQPIITACRASRDAEGADHG